MKIRCGTCGLVKSVNHFRRSTKNKSGFQNQCRACKREYDRKWQKQLCMVKA